MSGFGKDRFGRNISALNCDELAEWLEERGMEQEVRQVFKDKQIDGTAFMHLTETDCKELFPCKIGWVKKIVKLQHKVLARNYENTFKSGSLPNLTTAESQVIKFSQQEEDYREFHKRNQYFETASKKFRE